MAADSDARVSQAAKAALADLPGDNTNAELLSRLPKADKQLYRLLLELVGARRIDALPELLKAVDSADGVVRAAAFTALGATVSPDKLSVLINQAVAPKHAEDNEVVEKALMAASVRMPDREACAAELAQGLERAPAAAKPKLLTILGAVGGTKALQTVGVMAKGPDPELQDISSRMLGEWPTIDAAPVLLELARTAPGEKYDKYQLRALRGYIRIARQFIMADPERAEMCSKAMAACRQPAEQKLVVEVLKRYPSRQTLDMAIGATQNPDLKDEARQATLMIARALGSKGAKTDELRGILAKIDLGKVKLEIVRADFGAGANQKDVTDTIKKQAADSQLISLGAPTYRDAFGGDPSPGAPKQLKIQYRIDGKPAEATFAENALIVLPMPK